MFTLHSRRVLHHKNSYMNNEPEFEFMVAPIRAICILSLNSTEHLGSMQFHLLYQRFLVLPGNFSSANETASLEHARLPLGTTTYQPHLIFYSFHCYRDFIPSLPYFHHLLIFSLQSPRTKTTSPSMADFESWWRPSSFVLGRIRLRPGR